MFMREPVITDNLVLAVKIAIRAQIETNAGRARLQFALGIVKLVMSKLAFWTCSAAGLRLWEFPTCEFLDLDRSPLIHYRGSALLPR